MGIGIAQANASEDGRLGKTQMPGRVASSNLNGSKPECCLSNPWCGPIYSLTPNPEVRFMQCIHLAAICFYTLSVD